MKTTQKPLAFVDESGYIVPNPVFSPESTRHLKGRFIYTVTELNAAIAEMNRRQDERRFMADSQYGADMVDADWTATDIEEVTADLEGVRETVPSLTASPDRKRKTTGKSEKLRQPNYAPLPDTLDKEQQGVDLTDEEREDLQGIDTNAAVAALFGAK